MVQVPSEYHQHSQSTVRTHAHGVAAADHVELEGLAGAVVGGEHRVGVGGLAGGDLRRRGQWASSRPGVLQTHPRVRRTNSNPPSNELNTVRHVAVAARRPGLLSAMHGRTGA